MPLLQDVPGVEHAKVLHSKASLAWPANCKRALVSLHSAPADDLSSASRISPSAPSYDSRKSLGDDNGSICIGDQSSRSKAQSLNMEMSRRLAARPLPAGSHDPQTAPEHIMRPLKESLPKSHAEESSPLQNHAPAADRTSLSSYKRSRSLIFQAGIPSARSSLASRQAEPQPDIPMSGAHRK